MGILNQKLKFSGNRKRWVREKEIHDHEADPRDADRPVLVEVREKELEAATDLNLVVENEISDDPEVAVEIIDVLVGVDLYHLQSTRNKDISEIDRSRTVPDVLECST